MIQLLTQLSVCEVVEILDENSFQNLWNKIENSNNINSNNNDNKNNNNNNINNNNNDKNNNNNNNNNNNISIHTDRKWLYLEQRRQQRQPW